MSSLTLALVGLVAGALMVSGGGVRAPQYPSGPAPRKLPPPPPPKRFRTKPVRLPSGTFINVIDEDIPRLIRDEIRRDPNG